MMLFKCKECSEEFASSKSLHAHIKKHNLILGDYYVKHFQRKNKLTGDLLQFKNYEDYFERDFSNYSQMIKWCETAVEKEVKDYAIDCLKKRIEKKQLNYAPNTIELFTADLPSMSIYKRLFGSYSKACEICNSQPMFKSTLSKEFDNDYRDCKIYIDTREQKPLSFKNSEKLKLDVGDYAVSGDNYDYTYVDRKSFADFCSTMTVGEKRFIRELQRCRDLGCYLFIVIECDLYKMSKLNAFSPKRYNLKYVLHNMKEMQHAYRDCCQFVFSGNRGNSQMLIPKLLMCGKKLWDTDMQYFLDNGCMNYYERSQK
jgi:hypothetical protein